MDLDDGNAEQGRSFALSYDNCHASLGKLHGQVKHSYWLGANIIKRNAGGGSTDPYFQCLLPALISPMFGLTLNVVDQEVNVSHSMLSKNHFNSY